MVMEFRPIISALMRNKVGALLIALQIAITLAVITNAVFIINERATDMARPAGLDEENSFVVASLLFKEEIDNVQQIREDLANIRALPGVAAVTPMGQIPISGSGWGEDFTLDQSDPDSSFSFNQYLADEHGMDALDFEMVEGRYFTPEEITIREPNAADYANIVVISKPLADEMFPEESAVGKTVWDDEISGPTTIIGVYDDLKGAWPTWRAFNNTAIMGQISNSPRATYMIRAEPGQRDRLMAEVEALMEQNRGRLVLRVRSMEATIARTYSRDRAMIILLSSVVALLAVITALGIVGLAWFSVSQRRKSIGTRRALGARKVDILRYFMLENWIVTTVGLIVGGVLTMVLNYFLDDSFQIGRMDWYYLPVGMGFLWILGQVAVWLPARRAANIVPAMATRSV
jgi:putative ABC transport system permease protein